MAGSLALEPIQKVVESNEGFVIPCFVPESQTWGAACGSLNTVVLPIVATREKEGREASPTAAIIDSQSAKAAQKGAPRSTRKALMRARKSRAANGISLSTRSAFS